jgi:hypothetical protein
MTGSATSGRKPLVLNNCPVILDPHVLAFVEF